jgi:hypothetical protein
MHPAPSPKNAHRADQDQFLAFSGLFAELLASRWETADCGRDPREAAVPLATFQEWPGGEGIALWLLYHAYIEHHRHVSDATGPNRPLPQPTKCLILTEASCFILTEAGYDFVYGFLTDVIGPKVPGAFESAWNRLRVGLLLPAFDHVERLFTWGRHCVKRFRQPAPNQELVLSAGEELAWPVWFDDPLPRTAGINPKVRLHDTIKNLNLYQEVPIIHFRGDSGTQVGWKLR